MWSEADHRLTPRFKLQIPFWFSMGNSPLDCGHSATTVNISKRGIFFLSEYPFFAGLAVRLLLRMPSECGGKSGSRIVMTGLVSRVSAGRTGEEESGVGVEFICSEPFNG